MESILKDVGLSNDFEKGILICYYCQEKIIEDYLFSFFSFLIATTFLLASTFLPDILEPAKGSFHRGKFHSVNTLILSIVLFIISILSIIIYSTNILAFGLCGLTLGYIIHLLQDSRTVIGLPVKIQKLVVN